MVTVASAAEARAAVDAGADVVVAQGREAGGHVQSDVTTMSSLPRVADGVPTPGRRGRGLADGRGLAAALTLDADGGWFGTRFVATEESGAHEAYRHKSLTRQRRRRGLPTCSTGAGRTSHTESSKPTTSDSRPVPIQVGKRR